MFLRLILIILLNLFFAQTMFASEDVCQTKWGSMYCSAGEVSSVFHMGDAVFSGTHINGTARILGDLDAHKSQIGSLVVMGKLTLAQSAIHDSTEITGECESHRSLYEGGTKVTGNLHSHSDTFSQSLSVIGDFKAEDSIFKDQVSIVGLVNLDDVLFEKNIEIQSCLIQLSQIQSSQITIKPEKNCPDQTQKIYLRNKSKVTGNIQFTGATGKVFISKDSVISGQVIGGSVVLE
jgi:hypothetical protein